MQQFETRSGGFFCPLAEREVGNQTLALSLRPVFLLGENLVGLGWGLKRASGPQTNLQTTTGEYGNIKLGAKT